eukprot:9731166-Heterocapsa_arctica.AAC.1
MRGYWQPPGTLAPEIPFCGRYATGSGDRLQSSLFSPCSGEQFWRACGNTPHFFTGFDSSLGFPGEGPFPASNFSGQ